MALRLGDVVPDFTAESTLGLLHFYEFIHGHWSILFSHPNDFTPVCTSELASLASLLPQFHQRRIKILALSCNHVQSHLHWIPDIQSFAHPPGSPVLFPILSDPRRLLAHKLGMLDPHELDAAGDPLPARSVFVIGPDKRLKLSILYPATTGRSFAEVLRVVDSLLLTARYSVATPVDWKPGDKCMVAPTLSNEEAKAMFPKGFETVPVPSGKEYIRLTPQPDL